MEYKLPATNSEDERTFLRAASSQVRPGSSRCLALLHCWEHTGRDCGKAERAPAGCRAFSCTVSEKLIKFRLDRPLRECLALAESLRDKFELSLCEVVPSDAGSGDTLNGLGVCAAAHLETYLVAKTPTILAFSSGRTLRSMVEQIPSMHQPQHKIVSIVGNMSQYGRAGRYEVVMHLSDRIGSQAYSVPIMLTFRL